MACGSMCLQSGFEMRSRRALPYKRYGRFTVG
jgi:hypothetical protein